MIGCAAGIAQECAHARGVTRAAYKRRVAWRKGTCGYFTRTRDQPVPAAYLHLRVPVPVAYLHLRVPAPVAYLHLRESGMQVSPGTGSYLQHLTGTTCTCELPYPMASGVLRDS